MSFITVGQGGPQIQGIRTVTLTAISEPREFEGQFGRKMVCDWTFAINDGQQDAGETLDMMVSESWGPRSTKQQYVTALLGGQLPPDGTQLEREHLVGREAQALFTVNENGYSKIENLMPAAAVPAPQPVVTAPAQPAVPAAPTVPARPAAVPVAQAHADGSLPF